MEKNSINYYKDLINLLHIAVVFSRAESYSKYYLLESGREEIFFNNLKIIIWDISNLSLFEITFNIDEKLNENFEKFWKWMSIKEIIDKEININLKIYTEEILIFFLSNLLAIMIYEKQFLGYSSNNWAHLYILELIQESLGIENLLFKFEAYIEDNFDRDIPVHSARILFFLNRLISKF